MADQPLLRKLPNMVK